MVLFLTAHNFYKSNELENSQITKLDLPIEGFSKLSNL